MPTWPASLPQRLAAAGYGEEPDDDTARTQMDTGPDKVRPRTTGEILEITGALVDMLDAQVETLRGFWRDTLAKGSLSFDWVHPRTQAAVTMRFRSAPKISATSSARRAAQVELEILP